MSDSKKKTAKPNIKVTDLKPKKDPKGGAVTLSQDKFLKIDSLAGNKFLKISPTQSSLKIRQ